MSKAREWREKAAEAVEVVDLELPSGMVIRARRPDPVQLAMWNKLPLALAARAIGQNGAAAAADASEMVESITFMRDLILYCCVEPRVSLQPREEDEIHPRDIPEGDWKYIVRWAMRAKEAEDLGPFRGGRAGDPAGRSGEDVGRAAVGAAGDEGPVVGVAV